jgi:hypothetical protein
MFDGKVRDVDPLTAARLLERGGIPPRKVKAILDEFEMVEALGCFFEYKRQRKHPLSHVEAVLHYYRKDGSPGGVAVNVSEADWESLGPLEPQ